MSKKTIFIDNSAIERDLNSLNYAAEKWQTAVELYNAMELPAQLSTEDLSYMLNDKEAFMYDKQTAHTQQAFGGLELDKHKAFEIIKHPAGMDEFFAHLELIKSSLSGGGGLEMRAFTEGFLSPSNFEIKKGKVVPTSESQGAIRRQYTERATSADQVAWHEGLTQVTEILQRLMAQHSTRFNATGNDSNMKNLLKSAFTDGLQVHNGKITVSHKFIKSV